MSPDVSPEFQPALLAWYRANKRSLPWRDRQDDDYAVWISEIMLQQTTVNAVIGFYTRWLERFPTVNSLADAPLDDVLKQWAGLGYYARARNLHAAAKIIVEKFDGRMPPDMKDLLSLPGVGRYTAGAIASVVYQLDAPIVDANVIRVLCRLFALQGDPKTSSALQKQLWATAEMTIPPGEARDYNQAVMELGGLVCTPASPSCGVCPVATYCRGLASGQPGRYPEFAASKKMIDVEHCACLVSYSGKYLLVQRPLKELWGGLWELPRVALFAGESRESAALRAVAEIVGIAVNHPKEVGTVKHVVTNKRVSLYGYEAVWDGIGEPKPLGCRQFVWLDIEEFDSYAISSPQIELLAKRLKKLFQPTFDL